MVFSGHQPNFVPYMGFFYKLNKSDVFVFDDDVKFSKTERQNWNEIVVNGVRRKITIPVKHNGSMKINEVQICYDRNWDKKLLKTIRNEYRKYQYGEETISLMEKHLLRKEKYLVDLNLNLMKDIISGFGIQCNILVASKELPTTLRKNERNVWQCLQTGCDTYYSGTGGKGYNDENMYKKKGIKLVYSDYKTIDNNLSVIDYIAKNGWNLPKEWN